MPFLNIPAAADLADVLARVGAVFGASMVLGLMVALWRRSRRIAEAQAAPSKTPQFGSRLQTLALFNGGLVVAVVLGGLPHALVLALIGGLALREVAALARFPDPWQGWLVALPVLAAPLGWQALAIALPVGGLVILGLALRRRPDTAFLMAALALIAAIPLFAMPLALLALLRGQADGFALVAVLYVVPQIADGFAFLGGQVAGRRPLAPVLSPRKTWEGTAIGILAAMGAAMILSPPVDGLSIAGGALVGALMAIAAVVGDLAASFVKRALGIDDFGASLPGHGGVIDRLDSAVFAVPVGAVTLSLLLA